MTMTVCALSSSSSEQRTNSQEEKCIIEDVTADVSSPARSASCLENEDVPFVTPLLVRTLRMDEESPPEKYEMIEPPITDVAPPILGSTRTNRRGVMRACGGGRGKPKGKGCVSFDTHNKICAEADPPVLGEPSQTSEDEEWTQFSKEDQEHPEGAQNASTAERGLGGHCRYAMGD